MNANLALPGLPELTDSLINGGLYVLLAETASARFPMLASSLASGLDRGLNCRLLLQQNPESLVQRLQSYGNLNIHQAIQERQLQLFTLQDEFSKKLFRFGAEAFVKELEHFAFPDGAYVVFDQADELLALHDVLIALEQVEVLKKWTQAHQITFLLVLTRTSGAQVGTLNALMDNLTGIARLGAQRHGLELTFDYWQSNEGTTAGRSFNLKPLVSGLYEAGNPQQLVDVDSPDAGLERVDSAEAMVFYMDPELVGLTQQMQGKWQKVDTLIGMMHATRNMKSATCILLFQRGSQLRQLAETVHTLRLTMGRYARIVVQEKEASLRYQNEALLLKLGLNLVINRDVPLSRLPLLLESLKGQIFSRDVNINFEAALASVLPTQLHGYLLPARFVKEVALILERAKTLDVPCALMIGRPKPDRKLADLIAGNKISRAGDLITADASDCFVFLNACPQAVLFNTVERLLGLSVEDAFASAKFAVNPEEIQSELEALLREATDELLPDFTPEAKATESGADPTEEPDTVVAVDGGVPWLQPTPAVTPVLSVAKPQVAVPAQPRVAVQKQHQLAAVSVAVKPHQVQVEKAMPTT
ncbi:BcsE family c-di-GMP-binding protein, partial [Rhodoferax sp.]|uniref:BcsE family c-di-GMP-binding protein n=1 Tax=Rhodoferax sp. TaxID=50421 RepID=UPI00261537DA